MWENSLVREDTLFWRMMEYLKLEGNYEDHWVQLWSLQDYLQINHMIKSIVQTLTELWHTGFCNHFPGGPVWECDWPPSGWRTFSQCPVWAPLDAASFHFLVPHHRSPEREEQQLPSHCTPPTEEVAGWDEVTPQPSLLVPEAFHHLCHSPLYTLL